MPLMQETAGSCTCCLLSLSDTTGQSVLLSSPSVCACRLLKSATRLDRRAWGALQIQPAASQTNTKAEGRKKRRHGQQQNAAGQPAAAQRSAAKRRRAGFVFIVKHTPSHHIHLYISFCVREWAVSGRSFAIALSAAAPAVVSVCTALARLLGAGWGSEGKGGQGRRAASFLIN